MDEDEASPFTNTETANWVNVIQEGDALFLVVYEHQGDCAKFHAYDHNGIEIGSSLTAKGIKMLITSHARGDSE
jgi:hypothetical protein